MRGHKGVDPEENRLLWAVYQFAVSAMIVGFILWPIWAWAEIERVWTDFSPKPEVVVYDIAPEPEETPSATLTAVQNTIVEAETDETGTENLDKEKYRQYFEDKSLILMVLGGIEYWKMNCGDLSAQGKYFMKLAIKKHVIDEEEMHMDMSFQTGLFAAQLYNSCDHFLEQVKSIGLDMMFVVDPGVVPQPEAINNISNPET
tara:strand:- start:4671 stop:5276 length:606 start_codon:yes stop_codon:yes gene_type:complete